MTVDNQRFTLLRRLHGVAVSDVSLHKVKGKGWGVVATEDLATEDEARSLMTIPHELVLNTMTVETYAKESRNFRDLYEAIGPKDNRLDVLLFLLAQLAGSGEPIVSSCWNDYREFLPHEPFLPTQWSENERALLAGTSLEMAVHAKLLALTGEFESVREKSSDIPFWNDLLWITKSVKLQDWIMLDAWYRSRCLELPQSGHSMVPFLDMVNHSSSPTAYYEENSKDEVVLNLPPGARHSKGDEITISYGNKSAAEMLFSYGFIDATVASGSIILPLEPFPDDPLRIAKVYGFGEKPRIYVSVDEQGVPKWESPFAYLMCVNEEDGLEFRVLQDVVGNREMRVFWQEEDVSDRAKEFEALIQNHEISEVLKLRVFTVVQGCLQEQLEKLKSSEEASALHTDTEIAEDRRMVAAALRRAEMVVLEKVLEELEEERTTLARSEKVVAYLGLMQGSHTEVARSDTTPGEDDDFS